MAHMPFLTLCSKSCSVRLFTTKNFSATLAVFEDSSTLLPSTCDSTSFDSSDALGTGDCEEGATDGGLVFSALVEAAPPKIAGDGVDVLLSRQTKRTPWNLES